MSLRAAVLRAGRAVWKLPPLERSLVHATVGHPYAGLVSKLPPLWSDYPFGTIREATRYGLRWRLDLADFAPWYTYWGFINSSHDAFVRLCQPGATVVDVGANIGLTALRAARAVGPSGRVIAIEPDPENFHALTSNMTANQLGWVMPVHAGVSDRSESLRVDVVDAHHRGQIRLAESALGPSVAVGPLDSLVGSELVDVIKIDTEGFEARVLSGARETIARSRPTLFVEVIDGLLKRQGSSSADLLAEIGTLGYEARDALSGDLATPRLQQFDIVCRPNA